MNEGQMTQSRLRQLFYYDPATGMVTWRKRIAKPGENKGVVNSFNNRFAGKEAGNLCSRRNVIQVYIDGKNYLMHRIIWLHVTGEQPLVIDHINGDSSDNRFCNLRNVDIQTNNKNVKLRENSKSGAAGVHWYKPYRQWQAYINSGGSRRFIGYFDNLTEAKLARLKAERELGFHPNHGTSR